MKENEDKGLRYNKGKRKWSLVHFESLEPMVEVLEYGAHKYTIYEDGKGNEIKGKDISISEAQYYNIKISGRDNWKKGLDPTEILECMQRHLADLLDGKHYDSESGLPLMGHIQCNAMFYNYMIKHKKEDNDQNTSNSSRG